MMSEARRQRKACPYAVDATRTVVRASRMARVSNLSGVRHCSGGTPGGSGRSLVMSWQWPSGPVNDCPRRQVRHDVVTKATIGFSVLVCGGQLPCELWDAKVGVRVIGGYGEGDERFCFEASRTAEEAGM